MQVTEHRKQRAAAGDLELEVLNALWDGGSLSTPDVHARVGLPRELAYTTVLTVLQRLTKKGLVTRGDGRRSHVYTAVLSRDEYERERARVIAGTLIELGEVGVAAFLAEADRLDPEVLRGLRRKLGGAG